MVIAIVLLIIQIILGAITVLYDLPQPIVTAHLGTALAIFGTIIIASRCCWATIRPLCGGL